MIRLNLTRLAEDYQRLLDNEFFKLFMEKIGNQRDNKILSLESADLELVPKIQGEIKAIKWVLGRPKDMIDSILKESKI
jgi:hypothetical protein